MQTHMPNKKCTASIVCYLNKLIIFIEGDKMYRGKDKYPKGECILYILDYLSQGRNGNGTTNNQILHLTGIYLMQITFEKSSSSSGGKRNCLLKECNYRRKFWMMTNMVFFLLVCMMGEFHFRIFSPPSLMRCEEQINCY